MKKTAHTWEYKVGINANYVLCKKVNLTVCANNWSGDFNYIVCNVNSAYDRFKIPND